MDALHLLLYQFHQSPSIGLPFYCMLMDFGGFGMVPSTNAYGILIGVLFTPPTPILCSHLEPFHLDW